MPTAAQALIIVAILALGTAVTRFLPFVFFRNADAVPPYVQYLGKLLPSAAISLLVVYALRYVSLTAAPHGIPEAIGILVVVVLHIWKKNTLLSIAVGTVSYMLLVQLVF